MFKKIIPLFLLLLPASLVFSQQELGLHFMNDVWQSNKTNPAFTTKSKINFSFPGVYFNLSHTGGATYNEVVITNDEGNNVLDIGAVIDRMDGSNQLLTTVDIETFSISFPLKKLTLSLSHGMKLNAFLDYPKELIELAWRGNSQFIDQTIGVGPNVQAFAYNEFGIGASKKIANVSAGVKLKILTGIGDVSTENTKAEVYTDPDVYQLTFDTDFLINTSSFFKYNGGNDFEIDFGDLSLGDAFSSNLGAAIDLGVSFKVKKMDISASIIDLGFINWTKNVRNYHSQGEHTFAGVDFSGILHDDSLNFEGALDSLEEVLDFKETNNSYSTMLPAKIYLSANYHLGKTWDLGALFYTEMYRGKVLPAFALSARAKVGKVFSIGATYSIRNKSYNNLGLNAMVKLGPVQLFGVSDNLLSAVRPYDSQNANLRVGLNLMFKRKNEPAEALLD